MESLNPNEKMGLMLSTREQKMGLMFFDEMKKRYNEGDDSLELTMEKWERIFEYSKTVFHLSHFHEIYKAAAVPVFLCKEYANQCRMCPIYNICKQGHSDNWTNLMRVVQAYVIAGDLLPKDPFQGNIETFLKKLKTCREEFYSKMH
jgi:hypothetical protein